MKRTMILTGCLLITLLAVGVGNRLAAARTLINTAVTTPLLSTFHTTMDSMEFALEIKGDPHRLSRPLDTAVDRQGNLYVVDCEYDRIQKFDSNGQFLTMWGRRGTGDGEFRFAFSDILPSGRVYTQCLGAITVDGQDSIYIAEPINVRIQKFDGEGNFLAKWDDEGHEDGQFIVPISVAVDREDNVYVLDRNRDDVQKFDGEGRFLSKWKAHAQACYGHLAVDAQSHVYITGGDCSRVQKFDGEGTLVAEWGPGPGDEQFITPWGVAVDAQGNVYITEMSGQRIKKFDSEENFVAKWGTLGIGPGEFRAPSGLAVSDEGEIYVADFGNNRVQKFRQQ